MRVLDLRRSLISPLEIMYEYLDDVPAATVHAVPDHPGVRVDVGVRQPQVRRQADGLAEQYVAMSTTRSHREMMSRAFVFS